MSAVILRIQFVDGRSEERPFEVGAYRVGRETGELVLGDGNVSTLHARIDVQPGQVVVITDLGSTNGTFDAAGNRLTAPFLLGPNQAVRFGSTVVTLLGPRVTAAGTNVMPQYPAPQAPPAAQPAWGAPAALPPGAPPAGALPPGPAAAPAWQLPFAPAPAAPGSPVMDYALWQTRVLGYLIDSAFVVVVMGVLYAVLGGVMTGLASVASGSRGASDAAGGLCCMMLLAFPAATLLVGLFNRIYLVSTRGASIGQGVMKLKVVDARGDFLSMGAAAVRLIAMIVIAMLPFGQLLDLLWPLWDPQRQTLHDKAVNSYVINDRR